MLMPELVEMLRVAKEEYYGVEKRELDEQELEEINGKVHQAMEQKLEVTFTFYKDARYIELIGYILSVNTQEKSIYIIDKEDVRTKLRIEDILKINIEY